MSIFPGDLIIKTAIELALDDLRKNPWIIEDIFKVMVTNPYLKKKYGWKEVERAKEFLLNNNIPVYMKYRLDKQEFPSISIAINNSNEDKSLATLGDLDDCVEEYTPSQIGQPISYIVPPFIPSSYDKVSGIIEVPTDVEEYKYIGEGMVVASPTSGIGFVIIEKAGNNGFRIASGSDLPSGELAIVPRFQTYRARRERIISQETYHIGCHTEGDPSTLLFVHSAVKYCLLRYRESLLEFNGFELSTISSTDMIKNDAFGAENIYSRFIVLSGQAVESWVKTPYRKIEAVDIIDREEKFERGIQVISQDAPDGVGDDEIWTTVDDK